MPLQAAHMLVAAYVVGGFLVASVYAVGHAAGAPRPLPPARVHHRLQRRRGRHPDPDGRRATRWPAGSTTTSRSSSPRSSWCPPPSSDVPETLLGHLNDDGTVSGGIPIPGLASWLSDPSTGRSTVVQGLDTVPADAATDRPPGQHRPPGLGRHGRAGNAAVPVVALVRPSAGCSGAGCRRASCSCGRPPPRASWR